MHPTDLSAARPLTPAEQIGGLQRSLFNALAETERLREALKGAYATVCDAVCVGKVRYEKDFACYSPWPELRDREKAIVAALGSK